MGSPTRGKALKNKNRKKAPETQGGFPEVPFVFE
jgi:hypothetical protein